MIGYFDTELGRVQIAPAIVRRIIAKEIDINRFFRISGAKIGEQAPKKVLEKSIRINFEQGTVEIILALTVLYGTRIIKEARELQGTITRVLELQAGLTVRRILINVENVFEQEKDKPLLLEECKGIPEPVNSVTAE
ncbi:MAG: Asp23/Gls24 family envelope stress response protein [bacterium]|jgi:uncharacterized alkaline shock family protein YloU|nr:Asp23/Gls24 family envelope stress response protein [bacterium]